MRLHKLIFTVLVVALFGLSQVRADVDLQKGDVQTLEVSKEELAIAISTGPLFDYSPSNTQSFTLDLGGCNVKIAPYLDPQGSIRYPIEVGGGNSTVDNATEIVLNPTTIKISGKAGAGTFNCSAEFKKSGDKYTIDVKLSGSTPKRLALIAKDATVAEPSSALKTILIIVFVILAILLSVGSGVGGYFYYKRKFGKKAGQVEPVVAAEAGKLQTDVPNNAANVANPEGTPVANPPAADAGANEKSKMPDEKSKMPDEKSKMPDEKSKAPAPDEKSKAPDEKSKAPDEKSKMP